MRYLLLTLTAVLVVVGVRCDAFDDQCLRRPETCDVQEDAP